MSAMRRHFGTSTDCQPQLGLNDDLTMVNAGLPGARDSELLHARLERCAFHAQHGGSTLGSAENPLRFLERPDDVLSLRFSKCCQAGRAAIWIGLQFRNGNMQYRRGREDDSSFDKVLQFTHIARPVVSLQGGNRFGGDAFNVPIHSASITLSKIAYQSGNILAALTERRNREREHVKAIEEIAAECGAL